jgi:hypothetical protein
VRSGWDAALNSDDGWAGDPGGNVSVSADRPFRLRIELEALPGSDAPRAFRLQVRRNRGEWVDVPAADFPYPDEIASPRVSVVSIGVYAAGAATEDLIRGSALPFRPGTGVVLDSLTDGWSGGGVQGEWEWPVVIRRFADGAVTNDAGDTFEFRMADAHGRPAAAGVMPELTLTVPPRLLGGTFVETPGRLGPWQASNGGLYFVMEPAETDNVLMVVKSEDGGDTWREVDGAHRPTTDDLEGFATAQHDGRIHMLHQTSDAVRYHVFRTSDVPNAPDRWAIRDELVARPGEPPTQVAALAVRSDGSAVGVYGDARGLRYRIRSPAGSWGDERGLDGPAERTLSGPQVILGPDDVVHLAYTASDGVEGSVWSRTIDADGSLGPAELISTGVGTGEEDVGAVLPLVYLAEIDAVVVLYRLADGGLWERRITGAGRPTRPVRVTDRPVVQSAVDSDQVGADAIGDGATVHVLFIDEETRALYHVRSGPTRAWDPAARVVDGIDAQWVRGARLLTRGGSAVYGFVFDAGSDGGSGMNHYGEVPLGAR